MNRRGAYDDVVLGSGMAGMTAALLLAKQGRRVALVERHTCLAPLLHGYACDGIRIAAGFHLSGGFQNGGALSVLLGYLGVLDELEPQPLDEEAFSVVQIDEEEPLRVPWGRERLKESLSARYPGSRHAIAAYLDQVWRCLRGKPFLNFDGASAADHKGGNPPGISLEEYLRREGCEPDLLRTIDYLGWLFTGTRAHESPLEHHNLVMGSLYQSAHVLRGGSEQLVEAYKRQLARAGVEMFLGRPARRVVVDDARRVRAVDLKDGQRLECTHCISTMHPQRVGALFDASDRRPRILERLARRENTFALFGVFLKVPHLPRALHRSVHFRVNSREGRSGPDGLFVAGSEPSKVESRKSKVESPKAESPKAESQSPSGPLHPVAMTDSDLETRTSKLGPPSMVTLFSPCCPPAVPRAADAATRQRVLRDFRSRMSDKMTAELAGMFPAAAGDARVAAVLTPATYEAWTGTVDGSAYGLKHTVHSRPVQPLTDVGGFYLAGHSIVMNGLVGAAISGVLAAGYILGHDRVMNGMKQWRDAR